MHDFHDFLPSKQVIRVDPAVCALLCVTALPIVAQTKVLVAKRRRPVSVVDEYHGGIAFPTACDEQGRAPFRAD
jgi:hypothetical protein